MELAKCTKRHPDDVTADLNIITKKLRALGDLFGMARGEPPTSEEGYRGVAYLLLDLANELTQVTEAMDAR